MRQRVVRMLRDCLRVAIVATVSTTPALVTPVLVAPALVASVLATPTLATPGSLVINELLASNHTGIADADGDHSDWLELYNGGGAAIDLAGYTLTDDPQQPARWSFPAVTIEPGAFLLVWASGKDRATPGELHASFKLDRDGEFAGLYLPGGAVADSLSFGVQTSDVAYGRIPDGTGPLVFLAVPTPAAANQEGEPPPPAPAVWANLPEGVYAAPPTVALATDAASGAVRYTTDGSPPGAHSRRYTAPLRLEASQVLRAAVFADDERQTPIMTRTFVVGESPVLPVLSLAADPDDLWDHDTGIMVHYEERGREWERDVHVTLIENGREVQFSLPAGVRVHGGWSRRHRKKALRLYFRSDYGASSLHHRLFPQKDLSHFDRLVLHAGSSDQPTGGPNWTLLRDSLTAALLHEAGGAMAAFRPVNLYLNGAYWGIYWVRERLDADYLADNFGSRNPDLIERDSMVHEGTIDAWRAALAFFEGHDLRNPAVYAEAQAQINLQSFIDYQIVEIYTANWDWPHNNNFKFSDRDGPDPWAWILWDVDNGYATHRDITVRHNTLAWAMRDRVRPDLARNGVDDEDRVRSTLLLRKLLANPDFRVRFINRFADLLNTTLAPAAVDARITELAAAIDGDIEREIERWTPGRLDLWLGNVERLRDFTARRPDFMRGHIEDELDAGRTFELRLETGSGAGQIAVNSVTPAALPWSGIYFRAVPVTLQALPAPGYAFAGWSDPELPVEPVVTLLAHGDRTVHADFVAVNAPPEALDDLDETLEDVAVEVAVLTNDADPEHDPLEMVEVGAPGHGVAEEVAAGVVRYTPAANYNGPDAFSYVVSDGRGGADTAAVHVVVLPVNDPPQAADDAAATDEDRSVTFDLLANDADVDGDSLIVIFHTHSVHGEVVVDPRGPVTYRPQRDFHGGDGFIYTVRDAGGAMSSAGVALEVRPVNDPPVAEPDRATTAAEQAMVIAVLANDHDPDGDLLELLSVTQGAHGTAARNADRTVTYTPDQGASGTDTFTYTIGDPQGAVATGVVEVEVTTSGLAPRAADDQAETPEDVPVVIDLLANDVDPRGDSLVVATLGRPVRGAVADRGDGTVSYVPDADANGLDRFTYGVRNSLGLTSSAAVLVAVLPVNDPPRVAVAASVAFPEDSLYTLRLDPLVRDPDHLPYEMEWSAAAIDEAAGPGGTAGPAGAAGAAGAAPAPSGGLLVELRRADRTLLLRGSADYFTPRPVRVRLAATDPEGASGADTLAVTIRPVNDPPSPAALRRPPAGALVAPDTVRLIWTVATDADGDPLTYTVSIRSEGADTTVALADTTLGFDFTPLARRDRRTAVDWSVTVSDGMLATGGGSRVLWLAPAPPPLPAAYALARSVPNPFGSRVAAPSTAIGFALPEPASVRLSLYDAAGRRVRTLIAAELPGGAHVVRWDGRNDAGAPLASGVYWVRLQARTFTQARKLLLVR